jgi:hypothetical protein
MFKTLLIAATVATVSLQAADFAQLSSSKDQRPTTTGPTKILLDTNDAISGIIHDPVNSPGDIKIKTGGAYIIIAAPQVGRLSGDEPRWVDIWFRLNDKDVPNSGVRLQLPNKELKDVIVSQSIIYVNEGDILSVWMSVEVANEGLGLEAINPPNEPRIPSIIFSISEM